MMCDLKTLLRRRAVPRVALSLLYVLFPHIGNAQTPTLIQRTHASMMLNSTITSWKEYIDPTPVAGNFLAAECSYSGAETITVTDDQANTWNTAATANDTGNRNKVSIFYAANAAAGTSAITFTAGPTTFLQCDILEFYNIATSSPMDGSSTAIVASSTSIAAGSFTTTVSGDLILQAAAVTDFASQSSPETWSAGSGFKLLGADGSVMVAQQYEIQSSAGAVNPAMGISVSNPSAATAAVAFKAAATGGDYPTGIRVRSVQDYTLPAGLSLDGTSVAFQLNTTGNLVALAMQGDVINWRVTGITSSPACPGGWTLSAPELDGDTFDTQWWQCPNAPPISTATLAFGGAATASNPAFMVFYEMSGAATSPLDTYANASGNSSIISGPLPGPTITPSSPNELVLGQFGEDSETACGVNVGLFDAPILNSGKLHQGIDLDGDEGYVHYYSPNTTAVPIIWTMCDSVGNAVQYWVSQAVAFKAAAGSPAAESIVATTGTPQTAAINNPFAIQLTGTVTDATGNPMSGVTVTFTAPSSGASGTFAGGVNTATTNFNGVASAPVFTANSTPGSYTINAAAAGAAVPAYFSLTNSPGPAANVVATAGTPQSAAINTAFASRLQATVTDAGNNPLSGVTVTFTAPSSGPSGTFAGGVNTASTNASGVASAPAFTANATTGGPYIVTASVSGAATAANFSLTNLIAPATPAKLTATAGSPQSTTVSTAFAIPFQATVTDGNGNVVSGALVTFAAPSSGARGTFAGGVKTATTNASGVATAAVFTANATAGSYTVAATVKGVATPASFLLTNNNPAPTITTLSPSSTGVGAASFVLTITGTGFVAGATVNFGTNPPLTPSSITATRIRVIIPTADFAAGGTINVTVANPAPGGSSSAPATFTATALPDFSLSATPASQTVTPGSIATYTATATALSGSAGTISFGVSKAPSGATAALNPTTVNSSGATSLMVTTTGATPAGSYSLTITGTNGVFSHTATVTLVVSSSGSGSGGGSGSETGSNPFVQENYSDPQGTSGYASQAVTYTKAQTAGDLNVVVVGWFDGTATVKSVTDSSGNLYALAVGPTVVSNLLSQSIYYAKNIAAAAASGNTVTVAFSVAAQYPDIRIAEYGGLDPNSPFDIAASGSGSSATSSSGPATTTNAQDLVVGANIVYTGTSGAGSGFTSRVITSPDADDLEDMVVSAIGTYQATAPLTNSGTWVMQLVAFKAAPQ